MLTEQGVINARFIAAPGAFYALGDTLMLYTIAVILLILWLAGFAFHVAGGLIHILLVIAVIVVLVKLFTGRNVV
ncbi:hypothetical protein C8J46_10581 [Sphingomonas sp. PP-F2F-A104-K0414]|nr:hypothetical protein C8J46_10581 [Sphingomonas sp. PP-F2F-A104-K0414]